MPASEKKGRLQPVMGLMLNSMVDMLTILLVFLLKSFSTQPELNVNVSGLTLPGSHSDKPPEITTTVIVTRDKIMVGEKMVARIVNGWQVEGVKPEDWDIPPLLNALKEEAKKQEFFAKHRGEKFEGKITLIADKHMPFLLLKKILYNAGQAGFSLFKFATYKEEGKIGEGA